MAAERKTKELFIEPVDYSLIKDAFKNSRTIIMAGNRGTGKTAIVFDLIRNAPQNSFILYIDDFSSLSEHPSIKDFYKIIYIFLTIFLYLLKCPQSLILSALRAFCFCGKPHISRSIFLYFRYQAWLKSW